MELTYYLNQANIPQNLIHNQIDYGIGYDLVSNLNTNTESLELDYDNINKNYTFFLTFEKRRHHAQILLSNFISTVIGGYTIGINSTNEIFFDCPRLGFSYIFDIKLGNRNCICIKRQENIISVYKYDVISGVLESHDSVIVNSDDDYLEVDVIHLFGHLSYPLIASNKSSIGYFSGFVDQMVVISEPIDQSLIEVVFQGFRPEVNASTLASSFTKSDRYGWISPGIEPNKQYFDTAYQTIDQYLFTGSFPTGAFIAYETGVFGSSTEFVINNAYYTGVNRVTTGISVNPGLTATYYSGTIPPGVTNYSYASTVSIHKYSGRMSVSREVSLTNGGNTYRFDYNSAYIAATQSTGLSSSFDAGYYENFKMDGVYSDSSILFLTKGDLQTPTGYHLLGEYDFSRGSFYVPYHAADSSYYLDGFQENSGVLNGNYLTITGAGSNNRLEYDNTNGYTIITTGPSNYLEGSFFQRSSRVIEVSNYRYLTIDSEYLETTAGNMYHLSKNQATGTTLLFSL